MKVRPHDSDAYDPVVAMMLLAERGISPRYIARCLSRVRGIPLSTEDVERMVAERVRAAKRP